MPKNKNQHVTPKGYIRQFIDPRSPSTKLGSFVWVYERGGALLPYPKAPKKLTVKSYYYSWIGPDGERNDTVDEMLQHFEDKGIPILRKLDEGHDSESLTPQERYDFANFAALLTLRVPQFRDSVEDSFAQVKKIQGQLMATHPGYLETWAREFARRDGKPELSQEVIAKARLILLNPETYKRNPIVSLQAMLHSRDVVAEHVYNLRWRTLHAPDGAQFIAGDMPLVLVTTTKQPPMYGVGWLTPYMEATLPLSPRTCLLISVHHPHGAETLTPERVAEINLRSAYYAREFVYSSLPIDPRVLNKPEGWEWWKPVSDVVDLTAVVDDDGNEVQPTTT